MKKMGVIAVTALSLISFQAQAIQRACCVPEPKWYAGVSGGVSFLRDVDLKPSQSLPGGQYDFSFDPGYAVSGQLGYKILPWARLEGEVSYRENDLSKVNGAKFTSSAANSYSSQRSLALMMNGYLDYHNATDFTPYIGAGIGGVDIRNPLTLTYLPTNERHSFSEWVLGYQFMAGVSYAVPDTPFETTLGYRYLTGQDGEEDFNTVPGGYNVKFSNNSHNIELGARIVF